VQGVLQDLGEAVAVLGVKVRGVLECRQHEIFILFGQGGIAVSHDNDTAAGLHGYNCWAVLVPKQYCDTLVVMVVKDIVVLPCPNAHLAFQGLNVVGLCCCGMELSSPSSTRGHSNTAVVHVQELLIHWAG
jgi:hypothetical protein